MGAADYLKLGDWNAICDVCGFKFKASKLKKRWDGAMVCDNDWEPRHPQDLMRPPPPPPPLPFIRSDNDPTFVNPGDVTASSL